MANLTKNTDPGFEKRAVSVLAYRSGEIDDFSDLGDFLSDPFAKSAWKAVQQVKSPDAKSIAHVMAKNGWPQATPEEVRDKLLKLSEDDFEVVNMDFMREFLRKLSLVRNATPIFVRYANAIEVGKLSPLNAWEAAGEELYEMPGTEEQASSITTDEWGGEYAEAVARQQEQMAKAGHLPTWPEEYTALRSRVEFLIGRMIGILLDSGGGKTIFAGDILAHHWAENCGRRVDVFVTETSKDEMRWRHEIRMISRLYPDTEPPTLDMLEKGYRDDRCRAVTKPYKSGGRVRYIEAGGMRLDAVIAIARRDRADIILDVAHDIVFPGDGKDRDDKVIARGLERLATYAKKNGRNVVYTVQTDKMGRRSSRSGQTSLDASDSNGGAMWENKADIFLVGRFPRFTDETHVQHPFLHKPVKFPSDCYSPLGELIPTKGRKGGSGYKQLVWREGKYFDMKAIPPDQIQECTDELKAIRKKR